MSTAIATRIAITMAEYAALRKEAIDNDMTISQWLARIVREHLGATAKKKG